MEPNQCIEISNACCRKPNQCIKTGNACIKMGMHVLGEALAFCNVSSWAMSRLNA